MSRWRRWRRSLLDCLMEILVISFLLGSIFLIGVLASIESPWVWVVTPIPILAFAYGQHLSMLKVHRGKLFLTYDPLDFEGCRGPLPLGKLKYRADNDSFIGHRLFDSKGQRYGVHATRHSISLIKLERSKGDDLVFDFLQGLGKGEVTRQDYDRLRAELRELFGIETPKEKPLPP